MTTNALAVGFTGHRNLEDPPTVKQSIAALLSSLQSEHKQISIVTSAALGADTLFLDAASKLDIPAHVILPFPKERFRLDFTDTPDGWDEVSPLLEQASKLEIVADCETPEEAYMKTGVEIVENANILLAVWDRLPARGMGGTAEVVEYAIQRGKEVYIVDPITGSISQHTGKIDRSATS